MLALGIVLMVAGLTLLLGLLFTADNSNAGYIALSLLAGIMLVGSVLIIDSETNTEPEAIDVYRNRTTLKITYKDSVAIDCVVVFK